PRYAINYHSQLLRSPHNPTPFPYTTLFRSGLVLHGTELPHESPFFEGQTIVLALNPVSIVRQKLLLRRLDLTHAQVHIYSRPDGDRKSTRLNSSHRTTSYAVFCLKK